VVSRSRANKLFYFWPNSTYDLYNFVLMNKSESVYQVSNFRLLVLKYHYFNFRIVQYSTSGKST